MNKMQFFSYSIVENTGSLKLRTATTESDVQNEITIMSNIKIRMYVILVQKLMCSSF